LGKAHARLLGRFLSALPPLLQSTLLRLTPLDFLVQSQGLGVFRQQPKGLLEISCRARQFAFAECLACGFDRVVRESRATLLLELLLQGGLDAGQQVPRLDVFGLKCEELLELLLARGILGALPRLQAGAPEAFDPPLQLARLRLGSQGLAVTTEGFANRRQLRERGLEPCEPLDRSTELAAPRRGFRRLELLVRAALELLALPAGALLCFGPFEGAGRRGVPRLQG
jgi:hypothetical protein